MKKKSNGNLGLRIFLTMLDNKCNQIIESVGKII